MTKFKIIVWMLIFSFIGLVIFQNRSFFLADHSLAIDLGFVQKQTPPLPIALFFISFFLLGWLVAFLCNLSDRFKSVSQVNRLQKTLKSQQSAFESMKKDIEALKPKANEENVNTPQNIDDELRPPAEDEKSNTLA